MKELERASLSLLLMIIAQILQLKIQTKDRLSIENAEKTSNKCEAEGTLIELTNFRERRNFSYTGNYSKWFLSMCLTEILKAENKKAEK